MRIDALKLALLEALEIGVIAMLSFAAGGLMIRSSTIESALLGGIWAAVSALVVHGVDRRAVFDNARRRLIGSVLGGIVSGLLLTAFAPSLPLLGACAAPRLPAR